MVGLSVSEHRCRGQHGIGIGVYGACPTGRDDRAGSGVAWSASRSPPPASKGRAKAAPGSGERAPARGVHGETTADGSAAVEAIQLNTRSTGAGLYAEHRGNKTAGFFKGNVVVTGHIEFSGADCAEEFEVAHGNDQVPSNPARCS